MSGTRARLMRLSVVIVALCACKERAPSGAEETRHASSRSIHVASEAAAPPSPSTAASPRAWMASSRYIGSARCEPCHVERFQRFRPTPHARTSSLPEEGTVAGPLDPGKNVRTTRNPLLRFLMERAADGIYQIAELKEGGKLERHTERVGIVVGSGKMGQTYLYWADSKLYQLPLSCMTGHGWVMSPGYQDGAADFTRPIPPRCLECHATFVQPLPEVAENAYARDGALLGITCERCHGPGESHASYHSAHPGLANGRDIVYPRALPRDRQIDLCAQCHSGHGIPLQAPFSFRPGDDLRDFLASDEKESPFDTHTANQVPLLRESRCFRESPEMVCTSCHDPHQEERGQLALFSKRCQRCHKPSACGMAGKMGAAIADNCIDCHMPRQKDTEAPIATSADGTAFPMIRDHHIRVHASPVPRDGSGGAVTPRRVMAERRTRARSGFR